MCEFITASLSPEADVPQTRALFEAHGRSLVPLVGSPVAAALGADTLYFATHTGEACDCGTALGSAHRPGPASDDAALAKLRRQGWSEAKVGRWRRQQEAIRAREERVATSGLDELRRWHTLVGEILGGDGCRGTAKRIGLLLHTYRGQLADEAFTPARTLVPWREVEPLKLASLEPDRLYEFALALP